MGQIVADMNVMYVKGWGTLVKSVCFEAYCGGSQRSPRTVEPDVEMIASDALRL